jgi:hypothetical protein
MQLSLSRLAVCPFALKTHPTSSGHIHKFCGAYNNMAKMRAVQISKPGADFEIVEKEIPQPGPGQLRIKVLACHAQFRVVLMM